MRSNPSEYEMVAPGTLHAVVSLLAQDPANGFRLQEALM